MTRPTGGEEHLAPVIPLFGARGTGSQDDPVGAVPRHTGDEGLWRSVLADGPRRHDAFAADESPSDGGDAEPDADEVRRRGEESLVRRLRAKQLSVSEARTVLRDNHVDREAIEVILDEFQTRGYLDDRTLASLLVTSGVERKGQGRVALSRALSQRGIPRDIIDEALEELPDDDAERALEFARSKASGMSRLEPDTALRRLLGQLARRGYAGSVAMNAARTALGEVGSGRSGVRFVDSD
ncbi:regulatory protein RecX [Microbacterium sp. NPDC058342]|uniref:regulatory protein RecX n=1 Tax=Microbacterium sp. NPDC058342 TaxID=3346454 RepID=UPI003652349B